MNIFFCSIIPTRQTYIVRRQTGWCQRLITFVSSIDCSSREIIHLQICLDKKYQTIFEFMGLEYVAPRQKPSLDKISKDNED